MRLELEANRWHVINDNVMGGLSRSEVQPLEPRLLFRGQLSLENNGGFASIRCRFGQSFADVTAFHLVVRGDGRRYQFRLRADESSDSIAWRAAFSTDGSVQHIELALADFEPVIRGRQVKNAGALNPADIRLLGFMLADRQSGPFRLEVHAIETSGQHRAELNQ